LDIFKEFNTGVLVLPKGRKDFSSIEWSKHPTFEGVELKHIVTSKDTEGEFSYHLVKIAANCSIKSHIHETLLEPHEVIAGFGECINDGVLMVYEPGIISIMPPGIKHVVTAGSNGLYLFAKFIPALY
jgi:quercetin dioxygenase-like cupin family protein